MEVTGFTGLIDLTIMVFALSIAFAVFLIHKGIREKEAGLTILALILAAASIYLAARVVFGSYTESSAAQPETLTEQVQDVIQ